MLLIILFSFNLQLRNIVPTLIILIMEPVRFFYLHMEVERFKEHTLYFIEQCELWDRLRIVMSKGRNNQTVSDSRNLLK
jgi:hypothetical protein